MQYDLVLDPFGAKWGDLLDAARAAEDLGFDGIWTWDHLAGSVHGTDRVLECWTVLSALAAVTERVTLGPLVLNVANRRPGVLANAAATLQEVSGGRLLLGIGAGGGRNVPYPAEQEALGVPVGTDPERRAQVAEAVHVIRSVWSGAVTPWEGEHYDLGTATGFIRPDPPPPIVVGAFGPKMASVAGRVGDGLNTHGNSPCLDEILDVARTAHTAAGGDPTTYLITVGWPYDPAAVDCARLDALEARGVHRVTMLVHPPYDRATMAEVAASVPRG